LRLHHVLKTTDGFSITAEVGFFYIHQTGEEYLAYYDEEFPGLQYGRIRKGKRKWQIELLESWHAPEVWEHLINLERYCRENTQYGKGETYRLGEQDGRPVYFWEASGDKLKRFRHGPDLKSIGEWIQVLLCSVVLAGCILYIWPEDEEVPVPADTVTLSDRLAALPSEEEYFAALAPALQDGAWAVLSEKERLAVLQQVCDWETAQILGCSSCTLELGELENLTMGHYDAQRDTIVVSSNALVSWQQGLNVVLHESRHAWQWNMIELLKKLEAENPDIIHTHPFDTYAAFRETWMGYVDGNEDYDGYYVQSIEQDSRAWAEQRLQEYYYLQFGAGDPGESAAP